MAPIIDPKQDAAAAIFGIVWESGTILYPMGAKIFFKRSGRHIMSSKLFKTALIGLAFIAISGCDQTTNDTEAADPRCRRLHGSQPSPGKLISMKVPEDLLNAFKTKVKLTHTPYQAQIRVLIKNRVLS